MNANGFVAEYFKGECSMADQNQSNGDPSFESDISSTEKINIRKSRRLRNVAISSIVLGFLGFLTCGFTAPLGLLLGIMSLSDINTSRSIYPGKALATVGIIINSVAVILTILYFPANYYKQYQGYHKYSCLSNVEQLGLAMSMYMMDNDDQLPTSDWWVSSISSYIRSNSVLICPSVGGTQTCYAINGKLNKTDANHLMNPSKTVMIFESIPGDNPIGGKELLPNPPRHGSEPGNEIHGIYDIPHFRFIGDFYMIAFLDGHAEKTYSNTVDSLIWNPEKQKR